MAAACTSLADILPLGARERPPLEVTHNPASVRFWDRRSRDRTARRRRLTQIRTLPLAHPVLPRTTTR